MTSTAKSTPFRKALALYLGLYNILGPALVQAGPTIPGFYGKVNLPNVPAGTVPIVKTNPDGSQAATGARVTTSGSSVTVDQNVSQAYIDWSAFNVGSGASVSFHQGTGTYGTSSWKPDNSFTALNRIYDKNPSQILGNLTANGKIYLINQNGILFGPSSTVSVHSLVASTLNLTALGLPLKFKSESYQKNDDGSAVALNPDATVTNLGTIATGDQYGSVFLIGPNVENYGSISAPNGQIGLIAANAVELSADSEGVRPGLIVNPTATTGSASNSGSLIADTGLIGMYGRTVNQDGMIRAVTALRKNGQIELVASDRVSFGAGSSTSSPISDSSETAIDSFDFKPGLIRVTGIDTANPKDPGTGVREIEVLGSLAAPSGLITMKATDSITLGGNSSISTAGLWYETTSPVTLSANLNSVTLRDDYGQKDGILFGTNVSVDPVNGSSIGNLTYTGGEKTAQQRSVTGGKIDLTVTSGTLVAREGSLLDVTGGGTIYQGGTYATTKLASGNNVYDLSSAPEWLTYTSVLGSQSSSSKKFGLTGSYSGLYLGGGNALQDMKSHYTQGADAGTVQVSARSLALDGTLKAAATAGTYQTVFSSTDTARQTSQAMGIELPRGGTLQIGSTPNFSSPLNGDLGVNSLVVQQEVAPLAGGAQPGADSVISARMINSAGLSSVALYANQQVSVQSGAALQLEQGGSFTVNSRKIAFNGSVSTPGGSVTLVTSDNITSNAGARFVDIPQSLTLGAGSSIDVSGRRIDNTPSQGAELGSNRNGLTKGGTITLADKRTDGTGVELLKGASLDVDGGYRLDAKGNLTGADAGTISMTGTSLLLDGTLRGLSLAGREGGTLTLQTGAVQVVAETPAPVASLASSNRPAGLVLGAGQLSDTGFSHVNLTATGDIAIGSGVELGVSRAKLDQPLPGALAQRGDLHNSYQVRTAPSGEDSPDYLGTSSLSLTAGVLLPSADPAALPPDTSKVTLAGGSSIVMPVTGTVTIKAPSVQLDGDIRAASGTVAATASSGSLGISGHLDAAGYLKPDSKPLVQGAVAGYTPKAGGSVVLSAATELNLLAHSSIDVSGAQVPESAVRDGVTGVTKVPVASDAGSLSLSYGNSLKLAGTLKGSTAGAGLKGGSLTVASKGNLQLDAGYINQFQTAQAGFDNLTFKSATSLELQSVGSIAVGRGLTLDAPLIKGSGASSLSAPAILVTNSSTSVSNATAQNGSGTLNLQGSWLDLSGGVLLSGFSDLQLSSGHDIRLSDLQYGSTSNKVWKGFLTSAGDITLTANTIYPTTLANFSIVSTGGDITTRPGDHPGSGTILSAGGKVTLEAQQGGIDHTGVIMAPLGQIELKAPNGTAYLAPGSVLSSAGNADVNLGTLDDVFWTYASRLTNVQNTEVAAVPDKSVTVKGNQVVAAKGSTIDVSGGGSIYGYQFIPGTEGSVNPFGVKGRYVIVPDQSVALPGSAIYLAGGQGLAPGFYSILPEQYAFLPGAMVLTDLGTAYIPGTNTRSTQGYPVVAGYTSYMGNQAPGSQQLRNFSVRSAAQVLSEGHFAQTEHLVGGSGGSVTLQGSTTVIDGAIKAAALPDVIGADSQGNATVLAHYQGGSMALSGGKVTVTTASEGSALEGFDFQNPTLPAALQGTLLISDASVSGKGLESLTLGFRDPDLTSSDPNKVTAARGRSTQSVTLNSGTVLDVPNLTMAAISNSDAVVVQSGATVRTLGPKQAGTLTVKASEGGLVLQAGSQVETGAGASIEARRVDLSGELTSNTGSGSLNLAATGALSLSSGAATGSGMALSADDVRKITDGFANISLKSAGDLMLQGDVALTARGDLTLDAPRLVGVSASQTGAQLKAGSISLTNTGAAPSSAQVSDNGKLELVADRITVGPGDMRIAGYQQVDLAVNQASTAGDLVLAGKGSLSVDQNLTLTAARITSAGSTKSGSYLPADYALDASHGTLTIASNHGTAGSESTPGGTVTMVAQGVRDSGVIDLPSGSLTIRTGDAGSDSGIVLLDGATIKAGGSIAPSADPADPLIYAPGGSVALTSASAGIELNTGSLIEVDAAGTGDAGSIALNARQGGVTLAAGALSGAANGGKGGSLSVETDDLSQAGGKSFTTLARVITEGGFKGDLALRSAAGDISIDASLKADNIKVVADGGSITLSKSLDVSGTGRGGSAQLYARKDVTLATGSSITATGTTGGDVIIGTSYDHDAKASFGGSITQQQGAVIDVSGSGGSGGTVTFRAPRTADSVPISLAGTIKGASKVQAVGVAYYDGDFSTWQSEAQNFMSLHGTSETQRLTRDLTLLGGTLVLKPGVEIYSSADISSNGPLDLGAERYNGAAGELTIRSAGNLSVGANIVDNTYSTAGRVDAWNINLVAGADLKSADLMAVTRQGVLSTADNTSVYSTGGSLAFASGGNTVLGTPSQAGVQPFQLFGLNYVRPTLGTLSGRITGTVGGNLLLNGGVIQSSTGSIDLKVAGDLTLTNGQDSNGDAVGGSIRTTGLPPAGTPASTAYWKYSGGGDISLAVDGAVQGDLNPERFSTIYNSSSNPDALESVWSANYGSDFFQHVTEGLATMGGGSLKVTTGKSFYAQAGTFGSGDLSVFSRGSLGGHFLVAGSDSRAGTGVLQSMGSVGNGSSSNLLSIDTFNSHLTVAAQGNIDLGTVLNPTVVSSETRKLEYGHGADPSSVNLSSAQGDVTIFGTSGNVDWVNWDAILPPTLNVYAGHDIKLNNGYAMVLAPSESGQLRLVAENDISGAYLNSSNQTQRATLVMSDMSPSTAYGGNDNELYTELTSQGGRHASTPVHLGDAEPVLVRAKKGSISDLQIYLPKKAEIRADGDIRDIFYSGQNLPNADGTDAGDISWIVAGGNMTFKNDPNAKQANTGIFQGGPGTLVVQAGDSIDLGTTKGIQSYGNSFDTALGNKGANLVVAAGTRATFTPAEVDSFFLGTKGADGTLDHPGLQQLGIQYSVLKSEGKGDTEEAAGILKKMDDLAGKFFVPEALNNGKTGNISMTNSQISTIGGKDDLSILASGRVDVGKTTFNQSTQSTGIFTAQGGAINVFSGGDLNVNESRLMTFMGGDITLMSEWGDINAGRGSRTTVSASPPRLVTGEDGTVQILFQPPSVGSGIRALTFDPDGASGPQLAPEPGNVYLFAPRGTVDAGEAGIQGRQVFIAANIVLHAFNITAGTGSVGVPKSGDSTLNFGVLSGAGTVNENNRMIEQDSGLNSARERADKREKEVDDFMSKWLDLKIINFDEDGAPARNDEEEKARRQKK